MSDALKKVDFGAAFPKPLPDFLMMGKLRLSSISSLRRSQRIIYRTPCGWTELMILSGISIDLMLYHIHT